MFTGSMVAVATPMNEDGSIDFESFEKLIEFQNDHKKFLENYRNQQWDIALNFVKKWEKQVVEFDLYYSIFKERIKDMKLNLIDPNWNGAYVATTK